MKNELLELQLEVIKLLDTIHQSVKNIDSTYTRDIVAHHIQESITYLSKETLNSLKDDKEGN